MKGLECRDKSVAEAKNVRRVHFMEIIGYLRTIGRH